MKTRFGITSVSRRYHVGVGRALRVCANCLFALALAACSPIPKELGEAHSRPLRDRTAPLASQVDVTADRLAGRWQVVESAGALAPQATFQAGAVLVRFDGAQRMPVVHEGLGRFRVRRTEYWVHWMDADATVALVGSPKGAFVWIMQRNNPPPSRIAAAWEIFEWYGYNREWMRASK